MTFRVTVGRRVLPVGLPTLAQVQALAGQAQDAAQGAAAQALADAQPLIEAATQQAAATAATDAAVAAAPAAADAIRAQVATDADRAQAATIEARATAEDARSGKSPAISGGTGGYRDTSDGPHVEEIAASRFAITQYVGGSVLTSLDTVGLRYDLSPLYLQMRGLGVAATGIITDEADAPRVTVLPSGRRTALSIGTAVEEILGVDTVAGVLRPRVLAASSSLPNGAMVMRPDGALGLNGIDGPPAEVTFKSADHFPELIDSFYVTDDPAYATRVTQMAAAGAIVGARRFATFYARQYRDGIGTSEGPDNYVVVAYSDDPVGATGTWYETLYVVPHGIGLNRLYDSFLHNLPNGQIMLSFAAKGAGTTYSGGRTGSYGIIIKNPLEPSGKFLTSDPIDLGVGILSQTRIDGGGQVYGSLDVWRNPANAAIAWQGKWLAKINFSRLYDPRPEIALESLMPDVPVDKRTYDETMVVRLLDGRYLAQFRTKGGIGMHETIYDPATGLWSAPEPWLAHPSPGGLGWGGGTTGDGANGSRHCIARSPSGMLVMAFNRSSGSRRNMAVAISSDEGITWPHHYVFDTRDDVSYPVLSFDAAGNIHVVYDRGRGITSTVKDIIWVTIPEQSVIDGTPSHILNLVSQ